MQVEAATAGAIRQFPNWARAGAGVREGSKAAACKLQRDIDQQLQRQTSQVHRAVRWGRPSYDTHPAVELTDLRKRRQHRLGRQVRQVLTKAETSANMGKTVCP